MKNGLFKTKLAKIILTIIVAAAVCAAFVACDNGEENIVDENRTFEESWMSYISDEALVSKTAIPGAHDAGTFGSGEGFATQHSTIEQQLYAGVRYFDFRASKTTSGDEYYFVHADSNMPVVKSNCGQKVDVSMTAIKNFVERNPEEVIVMDFQHTWNATEEGLIELISSVLPMDKVLKKSECEDPTTITFGEMREKGKNIIILYKDTDTDLCAETDWLFPRSQYLQSQWDGSYHKSEPDVLVEHWQHYFDIRKDGVLFVLQGQLTGDPLEGREALIRPLLDEYLVKAVSDEEKLPVINVVMKDFVADNVEGCEITSKYAVHTILSLNVEKGTVKADKLEAFKTACGYDR